MCDQNQFILYYIYFISCNLIYLYSRTDNQFDPRTEIHAQGQSLNIQTIPLFFIIYFISRLRLSGNHILLSFEQRVSVGSSLFLYTIIASLSSEKI